MDLRILSQIVGRCHPAWRCEHAYRFLDGLILISPGQAARVRRRRREGSRLGGRSQQRFPRLGGLENEDGAGSPDAVVATYTLGARLTPMRSVFMVDSPSRLNFTVNRRLVFGEIEGDGQGAVVLKETRGFQAA